MSEIPDDVTNSWLSGSFDQIRDGETQEIAIAGQRILLLHQSATSRSELGRAFEHLVPREPINNAAGQSILRIGVGDGVGGEMNMAERVGLDSTIAGANSTTLAVNDAHILLAERNGLTWWDSEIAEGGWWLTKAPVELQLRASPLLQLLHFWGASVGKTLIHGAAVGVANKMVLIGAPGGAGKSTLAMAALLQGMSYCGDDYLMVDQVVDEDAGPSVFSLYATAKLDPVSRALLPGVDDLDSLPGFAERRRTVFDLVDHRSVTGSGRVAAVVVPVRSQGRRPRMVEIAAPEALRATAVSTVFQAAKFRATALRSLAQVCAAVPCYRLEADDPNHGAELLGDLLS